MIPVPSQARHGQSGFPLNHKTADNSKEHCKQSSHTCTWHIAETSAFHMAQNQQMNSMLTFDSSCGVQHCRKVSHVQLQLPCTLRIASRPEQLVGLQHTRTTLKVLPTAACRRPTEWHQTRRGVLLRGGGLGLLVHASLISCSCLPRPVWLWVLTCR